MVRPHSLRELLTRYAVLYLALIAFSSVLGGAGFYFWRQSSDESLRLNAMVSDMQLMRGAMYRQLKEIFDAAFLSDKQAAAQYAQYARNIESHFDALRVAAASASERAAIEQLHEAYVEVQRQGQAVLAALPVGNSSQRQHVLDDKLEQGPLREYESAFREAESFLRAQQERLRERLRVLTWLALLLLALPLATALLMLLLSRRFMRNAFVEPVSSLMRATTTISQGDLDTRVPLRGAAELRQLAQAVNQMAADLAQSRAALLQAERQAALGALVPVVAHNIRNPLASIRATAQVMDEPQASDETRQGLRDIIAATDRLERWTHSLLSYLHPLQPQLSRADLAAVTDGALALLERQLSAAKVGIQRVGWHNAVPTLLDVQLVEQALHGLLSNAIEASPPSSNVTLTVSSDEHWVTIAITDQGAGLAFAPAVGALAPGPSTKRFGSGLGIPFALKVAEVHGGSVRFAANESGGTKVTLQLPRREHEAEDE